MAQWVVRPAHNRLVPGSKHEVLGLRLRTFESLVSVTKCNVHEMQ